MAAHKQPLTPIDEEYIRELYIERAIERLKPQIPPQNLVWFNLFLHELSCKTYEFYAKH